MNFLKLQDKKTILQFRLVIGLDRVDVSSRKKGHGVKNIPADKPNSFFKNDKKEIFLTVLQPI